MANQLKSVKVKILDHRILSEFALPSYGTPGSAAMDLVACLDKSLVIMPGEKEMISSGIAVHIADTGYAALLLPRSGMGSKGLVLANLVGLIDSDYQGCVTIAAWNRSKDPITINPGDKIAQMLFVPVATPAIEVVTDFDEATERGENGFGSTDKVTA